jgi:uncharacterized protein (TIGR00730 family)
MHMAKNSKNEPVSEMDAIAEGAQEESTLVCINIPEVKLKRDPHTLEELTLGAKNKRASRIADEFDRGLKFVRQFEKSVTIYGSARFKPSNVHYKDARALAAKIAKEGYAVMSGGGPGIMEAANRGAKEVDGVSVGLNIELPFEQILNPYTTHSQSFYYFFSRKTTMSFGSEAYIFYPGGFGTLDELFEILTLVQTKKLRKIPIFLVGIDFWAPLQRYVEDVLYRDHGAINKEDMNLYTITDDHDLIVKTLLKSPIYK